MSLTDREFWTAVHGMILGAAFLLAFAGGSCRALQLAAEVVNTGRNRGKGGSPSMGYHHHGADCLAHSDHRNLYRVPLVPG